MINSIRTAFDGDENMFKYFDPSVKVDSIDEIINNVYEKVLEHLDLFDAHFVHVEGGYFLYSVLHVPMLISFGLSIKNRNKRRLKEFWDEIIESVGDRFSCFLWSNNTRAIRWLISKGMRIEREVLIEGYKVTILKYNLCH